MASVLDNPAVRKGFEDLATSFTSNVFSNLEQALDEQAQENQAQ